MDHFTKWKRPEKVMEKGGGESIVDTTGFVPPNRLIKTYMEAGERLVAHRSMLYDIQPVIVEHGQGEAVEAALRPLEDALEIDPTRRADFTSVEADEFIRDIEARQQRTGEKTGMDDEKSQESSEVQDVPSDEGRTGPAEES